MVQIKNNKNFDKLSPKALMEATYKAAENFQVRAFFEAKDEILKTGKYSENEFYDILDQMIDAETERKLVLEKMRGLDPLFLEEIAEKIIDFPPENVIRDVIYLKEQGYVEELVEIKVKKVIKKNKGSRKRSRRKRVFF